MSLKTVNGWAFPECDDFMAGQMKPDGTYQSSHLLAAMAHVTSWDVCIDGGAHVGTWSRLLSQRFGRVIAVEPSPDTCAALRANMIAFDCANVEIHEAALGATMGVVSIAPLDPRAAAMKNTGARFVQNGGTIPRLTIESWQLPSLGFVKLDIEGSEPLALEGAVETLARCRPIVLFENKGFWRRYQKAADAPQQILARAGYALIESAGKDAIWGPRS